MTTEKAIFGAGCFWGVEENFRKVLGVIQTTVGYSGGDFEDPTYKDVCSGETGHAEVVLVEYDPSEISYDELLDIFFQIHNPTTLNRQGFDIGEQYRSIIFYFDDEQKEKAIRKMEQLEKSGKFKRKIVTAIEPAKEFYKAEEYHQKYIQKQQGVRNWF